MPLTRVLVLSGVQFCNFHHAGGARGPGNGELKALAARAQAVAGPEELRVWLIRLCGGPSAEGAGAIEGGPAAASAAALTQKGQPIEE